MTDISEAAATAGTPIGGVLDLGEATISLNQVVVFTKFVRVVLPVDGFVFLVRADLLTPQALTLAAGLDRVSYDAPLRFTQQGSLHYPTRTDQDETKTYTSNEIIFTSPDEVAHLNLASPSIVYFGEIDGILYAFSSRQRFYRQANLWHYVGASRWSDMASQVITSTDQLDLVNRVVSNSLPIWLFLLSYRPTVAFHANPGIVLYPSYLVPKNLQPPYGVIHIEPGGTEGIAEAPSFSSRTTYLQLSKDDCRVTLYGYRNDQALDFIAWVGQYTLFNPRVMGIMNVPVVRDEKSPQVELQAIAMRKVIDFEVDYFQFRANDIARQLIKQAIATYEVA